jgi:hypothetical protein
MHLQFINFVIMKAQQISSCSQLFVFIDNLPIEQKQLVKQHLDHTLSVKEEKAEKSLHDLLLSGPVLSKEGHEKIKSSRKLFTK